MLTQLSRSLSTKFDNASYGIAVVRPNQRPVTAAPTAAIPSISCRYRIKPSRYPLQFIQEKMKTEKFRKVTLTLNQYLATVRGTPHYGIHAPINKKFKKKVHAFNPFAKVDPAVAQETLEYYEYMWAKKEHGKSGMAATSEQQVKDELEMLQKKQAERREKRRERVAQALSAADKQKQEERKARIQAKKAKARDAKEASAREDDDYEEDEPKSKSQEFVF